MKLSGESSSVSSAANQLAAKVKDGRFAKRARNKALANSEFWSGPLMAASPRNWRNASTAAACSCGATKCGSAVAAIAAQSSRRKSRRSWFWNRANSRPGALHRNRRGAEGGDCPIYPRPWRRPARRTGGVHRRSAGHSQGNLRTQPGW